MWTLLFCVPWPIIVQTWLSIGADGKPRPRGENCGGDLGVRNGTP